MSDGSKWLGEGVTAVTARSLPTLGLRLIISATCAALFTWKIDVASGLAWGLAVASAEAGVWITSDPQRSARSSTLVQRLAYVAAVTWMNLVWWALVLRLWTLDTEAMRLAALCLMSALLVHAQAFTARSTLLLAIIGGGAASLLLSLCAVFNDFPPGQRVVLTAAALMLIAYTSKAAATNALQGRALEAAKVQAEAASQAKSEFLTLMSHELRTPLAGMLGLAQALKLEPLEPGEREQVELLEDQGRALLGLLNDVLDLAKIEAGKLEIAPIPGDLAQLADRVVRLNAPLAREKGTDIVLTLDEALPSTLAFDPLRVRQCLANLISNAVKFTHAGQIQVRVSCGPVENGRAMAKVVVADTGVGMSPAVLDKLFAPFAQADASVARRSGGTGLGLNITRRLAQMMDGSVSARSVEGQGSTFTLTFACDLAAAETTASGGEADDRDAPLRLLVVDDYPINRQVIGMMLKPLGCEVAEAGDGQAALDALRARDFDMVLIDFNMPVMGGLEATRRIRAEESWKQLPIICLTAGVTDRERDDALEAGMDAFVEKPVELAALVSTIGRFDRRTGAEHG
jgi:signal transduction histidine kinase/ActR/RegA family two-component response regulator